MMPLRALPGDLLRSRLTAVALLVMLLGLSGCGGSQVEYQEVPGDPAEITLPEVAPPEDAEEGDAAAEEEAAPEGEEATPEPTATPEAGAGTTEAPEESTTQAEAPVTAEDGPETDEPPAPGTDAERFEDFCEQNAGAC